MELRLYHRLTITYTRRTMLKPGDRQAKTIHAAIDQYVMPQIVIFTLALLILAKGSVGGANPEPREAWSSAGPAHLLAVGRLLVPGYRVEDGYKRHYVEDCSATLVAESGRQEADIIVSAWHCLEHYRDVSKAIRFVLAADGSERLSTTARRIADGGHISEDWAVLKLAQPVPASLARPLTVNWQAPDSGRGITMAGYSGDSGIGGNGEHLSYHADCRILESRRAIISTDCLAYKGASGGAVTQEDAASGEAQLTGVISQGNGDDTSLFVPTTRFATSLKAALQGNQ